MTPFGQDTLATAGADSLASNPTVIDSVGGIEGVAQSVGETGRLLATGQWDLVWNRVLTEVTDLAINFVPRIFAGLFVGLVFFALYRLMYRVSRRIMDRSPHVNSGLQNMALKTLQVVGVGLVGVLILAQLGLNVTALVAGFGITGLALGFAAKDTLENFISGVTILLDKPFHVGETIRIEDVYGTVEEISLRSTWIRTAQSQFMVMPNTLMINQKLINFSRHGMLRIDIAFGIAYKESIAAARAVVLRCLAGDDRILGDPAPDVVVTELDDSSVNLCLRMFVADAGLEYPLRFEYLEKVREALRSADIEIPFPHVQLFIDEAKAFGRQPVRVRLENE